MKREILFVTVVAILAVVFAGEAIAAKQTIAVGDIEYRAKDSRENKEYRAFGKGVREDTRAFTDMLTTALVKTRKFRVIERDRLDQILKEQGLSLKGFSTGGYRKKKLSFQGVNFIVTGAITEFGQRSSGLRVAGFATSEKTARMAVDIRVINVTTGEIEIAESVSANVNVGGGIKIRGFAKLGEDDSSSALGEVTRKVANDVTNLIVSSIYPIRVLKRTGTGTVLLNYGNNFLKNGDLLDVFVKGEVLIDPDTNENLGSEDELVGQVSVFDARTRFSKAKIVKEISPIKNGMIARRTQKAEPSNETSLPSAPSLFGNTRPEGG